MKTRNEEAEEKRLRKNSNERRRYAELSKDKKEEVLKRRRTQYAESKKKVRTVPGQEESSQTVQQHQKICSTIRGDEEAATKNASNTNTGSPTYSYVTKLVHPYAQTMKGVVINDAAPNKWTGDRNLEIPLLSASSKGKAQISFYNSFDIGSTSICANKVVHLPSDLFPHGQGCNH